MERLIFHIDVNSAFLSWEAVRRLQNGSDIDLRKIPSVVGGDPSHRSSIVTAKSIPAKKYGIQTGEPVALAMRKCPDLVIVPSDFRLYTKNSDAFMNICREYAPELEKYSIDECFLDMSGTQLIYPDPINTAREIKDRIRDELGFTVNIGISCNKLLAKMASDFEKPDKIHTLFPEEIPEKMWPLPVSELFSVGKQSSQRLLKNQIRTIGDLAHTDLKLLQSIVGVKAGQQYHDFANGIDESPVVSQSREAKSYSTATTLEENVTTLEQASAILKELADTVAFRIRQDEAKAYCISVTIRDLDFRNRSHQKHLEEATDITTEIYQTAMELFRDLWDGHTPLRLLSLGLSNISREETMQMTLFPDEQKEKSRKLDRVMDDIRSKYGLDTISRGVSDSSSRIGRKYKAKFEK